MFFKLLEFMFMVFVLFTISYEVIIPALQGRKIFGSYRSKTEKELKDAIVDASQVQYEKKLKKQLSNVKKGEV